MEFVQQYGLTWNKFYKRMVNSMEDRKICVHNGVLKITDPTIAKIEGNTLELNSSVFEVLSNNDSKKTNTLVYNNKKAIVLCGRGNTGKSTTLKLVAEKLISNGAKTICVSVSTKGKDAVVLLEFNGKKIGIVSAGDTAPVIKDGVEKIRASNANVDVFILSSRSKGETKKFISSECYDRIIIWLDRHAVKVDGNSLIEASLRDKANEKQSEEIISLI